MIKNRISIIIITFIFMLLTLLVIREQNVVANDQVITEFLDNKKSVLESPMDIEADTNMIYADKEVFCFLKEAHNKIDFRGEFKIGNPQIYNYYKEKFRALVNNNVKFSIKDSKETFYLRQYNNLNINTPETYKYLFFDMDNDGTPELSINNEEYIYIFKYIPEDNQYILWTEINKSYYTLIGSQKTTWMVFNTRMVYSFYKLDKDANQEFSVTYMVMRLNDENIYMASLPKYELVTSNMKKQGYYVSLENCYYFRITKEQYIDLSKNYFEAINELEVMENSEKVTYTYKELWSS